MPQPSDGSPSVLGLPPRTWWIVLPTLLSLFVFTPWIPSAFPVWDYAEMLPLMRQSDGVLDAFQQLAAFTRQDGRANYLTYLQIALTWGVAADNPVGWQVQRAIFMLILGGSFAITAHRLGATATAAALGGLLAILTVSGTEGWIFLMGEPLAAIFLLWMILVLQSDRVMRGMSGPVLVALLSLGIVMSKEFLVILIPFALFIGMAWRRDDGFSSVRVVQYGRKLAPFLAVAAAIGAWSVLGALRDAVPGAYATAFGASAESLARIPTLFQSMLLPVRFASADFGTNLYPANLIWLLSVVIAATQLRKSENMAAAVLLSVVLVDAVLLGAIAYSFWPRYSAFYGIPFSLGGVGLFVASVSVIERRSSGPGTLATLLLSGSVIGFTAISSHRINTDKRAIADLAHGIATHLSDLEGLDTVLVVRLGPGNHRWPVTGPELGRYATAINPDRINQAEFVDADCRTVSERLSQPLAGIAIVNDQNPCGSLPAVSLTFIGLAPYRDWIGLEKRVDTLQVQVLVPQPTN